MDRGIGKVCDRASWVVLHTFKECHQDPQCSLIRWLLPYMGPLLEQVPLQPSMTMSQGTSHGSATQVIEAKDTTGRDTTGAAEGDHV